MNTTQTLGEKIRNFRTEFGISQMDLELQIESATGSISRMENGQTNPTKETIISISKALHLNTFQIASLFGIDIWTFESFLPILNKVLTLDTLEEVLDTTVNELVFSMGYLASAILLKKEGGIYFAKIANSKISQAVIDAIPKPLGEYLIPVDHEDNLVAKAVQENQYFLTHKTVEYCFPAFTADDSNAFEKMTGDKSNIIFPLIIEGQQPFGAIIFKKKAKDDFKSEIDLLQKVTSQIAIAVWRAL